MVSIIQSETFRRWIAGLKDLHAKAIILGRLTRLSSGLPGDITSLGGGLSELRVHCGPGYRIYFVQQGQQLVVLLCGGDKGSQSRDVRLARQLARQWRNDHG